jgi:hypothetical protein
MTTDCIDTFAVTDHRPAPDLEATDRHLRIAGLAAAALVIFVLPTALAVASLLG